MTRNLTVVRALDRCLAAQFAAIDAIPMTVPTMTYSDADGWQPIDAQPQYALLTEGDELLIWDNEAERDAQYSYYLGIEFYCSAHNFASIMDAQSFAYANKVEAKCCKGTLGETVPSIGKGESFGHPDVHVLPTQLNPMLRELSIANDDRHDELIEAIVMHPDFNDGYLDLAVDKYKNNPCAYRFNELTGCMLVYQWLDKA